MSIFNCPFPKSANLPWKFVVLETDTEWNCHQDKQRLLQLEVFTPAVIRVFVSKNDSFNHFSYAVVADAQKANFKAEKNQDGILLSTDSLIVRISASPVRVFIFNKNQKLVLADDSAFGTQWNGQQVWTFKKTFHDERFLGLGEKTGNLDHRGSAFVNWNTDFPAYETRTDPLYTSIPFYIGIHDSLMYGLYFDNSYKTYFNFGASNNRFSSFGADGGDMVYYVFVHAKMKEIIKDYTWLTGRMQQPPLWSLGFQQCRWSYFPQARLMELAQQFRDKKLPCDVLYLDIDYMDHYKVFTWGLDKFPNPSGMTHSLDSMGFKVITIIDPGVKVEKNYPAFESGMQSSIFLKYPDGTNWTAQVWPGWCNFPDFTDPAARSWWGKQYSILTLAGVRGFWNDMNEPASWGQQPPSNILFNYDGHPTTMLEGHNVFGMQMARATFEGVKQLKPDQRPFVLTRAGFAGLQRFTAVWTGDNDATDDILLQGVRMVSGFGLSGISFAAYDAGGFANNASAALYTRWMEVGAFCPMFRSHKAKDLLSSEPWSYGEQTEKTVRQYLNLRYRLLPYLYSEFYFSTQTGMPIQRSLAINYPFDSLIYKENFQNEYLFGPAILVAPAKSVAMITSVYLPKGDWYDFYDDNRLKGNQDIAVSSPAEKLPLFIKSGSIIPMQNVIQSTSEPSSDTLTVHVYFGNEVNHYTYYEDAGDGYDYQKGGYYKREIIFDPTQKMITMDKPEGNYVSHFKYIRVVLHGWNENSAVKMNDQAVSLQNETQSMLPEIAKDDPLEMAYSFQHSTAKYFVIENSINQIAVQWQ